MGSVKKVFIDAKQVAVYDILKDYQRQTLEAETMFLCRAKERGQKSFISIGIVASDFTHVDYGMSRICKAIDKKKS